MPAAWQEAIDGSEVNTGGVSTLPLAVGRTGEVAAVRDNGDTRDLLMIGADKSVAEIYAVPEPNRNNVGFVAMDDRWIVVGVDRIPRGSNGVISALIRIDVIDRQGGAVQTITQQSEADYGDGRNGLDSVALFGGKVYWITHNAYAEVTGTVSSHDLATGAVAEVASGNVRDVRATAVGLTWVVEDTPQVEPSAWQRTEVHIAAPLPTAVADALGTGNDRVSLATDGTAYAWLTGLDDGATGVAWWSPDSGLVRITGDVVDVTDWLPPTYVVGPYAVIDKGRQVVTPDEDSFATVVDARSGAVTGLPQRIVGMSDHIAGADGGSIALQLSVPGNKAESIAGVVRSDALPPLSC